VDLPFLPASTRFLGRQLMNNLHRPPDFVVNVCLIDCSLRLSFLPSIYQTINLSVTLATKKEDHPSSLHSSPGQDSRQAGLFGRLRRQQRVRVSRVHTNQPSSASSFPVASLPRLEIILPLAHEPDHQFPSEAVLLSTSTNPRLPSFVNNTHRFIVIVQNNDASFNTDPRCSGFWIP
jgi:hypothetical protein